MTLLRTLTLCVSLASATLLQAQSGNLDIYWVDVEGGAATLVVTPSGQSMLIDSGNETPDARDAKRIFEAAKAAGLKKIDMLVSSHYHGDHVGGLEALSKLIPIDKYYDHGHSVEIIAPAGAHTYNVYRDYVRGKNVALKPGEKLVLKGVDVTVVSSGGDVIAKAVNGGGPNDFCKDAQNKDVDRTENGQSVGILLTYGKFKFLDLGDLTWDREMQLACPVNKVGTVSVMQATHHGFVNGASGAPALVWAAKPQVIVVNDGPRKGLEDPAYETMSKVQGIEGIWQLHKALKNDAAHNTAEDMIANLDEGAGDQGKWIKVSVAKDGKYTVTNGRNNTSKTYTAR